MSADPHLAAVEDYIVTVVEQVRLGQLHDADALAALAADCLALSLQDHVHPDTADELLGMAQAFAVQRYALVNAAAAAIPDDIGGLDADS
jgi:hypothetical protein